MTQLSWFSLLLSAPLALVSAIPMHQRENYCNRMTVHKPWGMLLPEEKTAYIKAELCLMEAPSQLDIPGAVTRWDDLQWNHIIQAHAVHDVGHFLPWHRYYVVLHGHLLRDECGYKGPLPYWDETADSDLTDLAESEIFQEDAFGGNGSEDRDGAISTGPFKSTTLRLRRPNEEPAEYPITRNFNPSALAGAHSDILNVCFSMTSYASVWECLAGTPHSGGHLATGGTMGDVYASPGDPLFYLHHGWLDAMWWKWQARNSPASLTDMGGRNMPREIFVQGLNASLPGREFTDYNGDDNGTETTLNHVLWYAGLSPNVTVGDVMDVRKSPVCGDYVFSDSVSASSNTMVDGILTTIA